MAAPKLGVANGASSAAVEGLAPSTIAARLGQLLRLLGLAAQGRRLEAEQRIAERQEQEAEADPDRPGSAPAAPVNGGIKVLDSAEVQYWVA